MRYFFVNPEREVEAAKIGDPYLGLRIRVSTAVPKGEVWFAEELPDELLIDGNEVRMVRRLRIIQKMDVSA